ncbi:hypothetical protein XENOCAPTIV_007087 [Xenoophorus captivus]|uniref:DH domain-containing protein n=1 Tax=Xenoophorus captivus TaxID=1517983 RepID=A0ABV0Q9H3_9TELE
MFKQKRSMGLTLAEDELSKLGSERGKDQPALEKECSCAEHILTKIEEILSTTQPSEEEKWYETVSCNVGQYDRSPDFVIPEPPDHPALSSGRSRVNQLSQGSDTSTQSVLSVSSPGSSSSDSTGHETDSMMVCSLENTRTASLVQPALSLTSVPPTWTTERKIRKPSELFYTERAHLRMLRVLHCVFCQRLNRDGILPPDDIKHIFINLEEIIQLHGNEAESNRLCRRLQLKDIIPVEMQRVTKYPLLLDNIAKYTGMNMITYIFERGTSLFDCFFLKLLVILMLFTEDGEEREKVKKAEECCKKILNHVNQAVKEAENKQNLDLTKREMVHEGPLSWKSSTRFSWRTSWFCFRNRMSVWFLKLEAFLDGQLAERLLQEGSRQGIAVAVEDMELTFPSSKAEEALRTLAVLKEALYSHIMTREGEEETEENKLIGAPESQPGTPDGPRSAHNESQPPESSENDDLQPLSVLTGESESAEPNSKSVF